MGGGTAALAPGGLRTSRPYLTPFWPVSMAAGGLREAVEEAGKSRQAAAASGGGRRQRVALRLWRLHQKSPDLLQTATRRQLGQAAPQASKAQLAKRRTSLCGVSVCFIPTIAACGG